MEIQDFENIFKYKLYLPFVYVTSWVLMILGPFYFPVYYQRYYLTALAYLTVRSVMTFLWTIIGTLKANSLLNSYKQGQKTGQGQQMSETKDDKRDKLLHKKQVQLREEGANSRFYHAFIIPNYKEDESILESTLLQIASHQQAEDWFLVFLAMEAHQPASDAKAAKLISEFKHSFKLIGSTMHEMRPHEQKGKAANVSWCAEHLEEDFFKPNGIDGGQVMLTIIDADSWVPEQYNEEVNRHVSLSWSDRHKSIFQPCQTFTRNCMEVPALTRTYDMTHGMVHFSNLFSMFNTSFPLSNYSLSYQLVKEIGFWDTCPEAIGEDFHTTIKAFWKRKGDIKTVCIFTFFNQINIQTGKGYCTDMNRRFWQAQRHGRGCADAAYCLKRLFKQGISSWRLFVVTYQVLQITTLPAILPWCMIASTGMSIYYRFAQLPAGMIDAAQVQWMYNTCTLSFILSFWLYFYVARKASRLYYGLKNENWLIRSAEYILWFIPNIFLVTVPSATIAAFKVAFGSNEYEVAEKRMSPRKGTGTETTTG